MDATSATNIKRCTGSLVGHNVHVQLCREWSGGAGVTVSCGWFLSVHHVHK